MSALVLSGCKGVLTIDPVIGEREAIIDDRLLGDWRAIGEDDRARISRTTSAEYAVHYVDNEDTVQLRARLGRLGGTLVLDVYPDPAMWKARDESGVPTHSVFGIDILADSFALHPLDGDSILALARDGRFRVPYSRVGDDVLLHGDAVAMRAAVSELFQKRSAIGGALPYRREKMREK